MHSSAVQVLRHHFSIDQAVQFVHHETERVELVLGGVQVNADVFLQEYLSCFFVAVGVADAQ